jgi:hypothetical protein
MGGDIISIPEKGVLGSWSLQKAYDLFEKHSTKASGWQVSYFAPTHDNDQRRTLPLLITEENSIAHAYHALRPTEEYIKTDMLTGTVRVVASLKVDKDIYCKNPRGQSAIQQEASRIWDTLGPNVGNIHTQRWINGQRMSSWQLKDGTITGWNFVYESADMVRDIQMQVGFIQDLIDSPETVCDPDTRGERAVKTLAQLALPVGILLAMPVVAYTGIVLMTLSSVFTLRPEQANRVDPISPR